MKRTPLWSKAVPPAALTSFLRPLAVTLQVARTAIYANIVLSRNVEGFPGASFSQNLICCIEFRWFGELRDISRVQQKAGCAGSALICRSLPKCSGHIRICSFVEADMTVAYLHEEKAVPFPVVRHRDAWNEGRHR